MGMGGSETVQVKITEEEEVVSGNKRECASTINERIGAGVSNCLRDKDVIRRGCGGSCSEGLSSDIRFVCSSAVCSKGREEFEGIREGMEEVAA